MFTIKSVLLFICTTFQIHYCHQLFYFLQIYYLVIEQVKSTYAVQICYYNFTGLPRVRKYSNWLLVENLMSLFFIFFFKPTMTDLNFSYTLYHHLLQITAIFTILDCNFMKKLRAGKIAQQVKILATKLGDPHSQRRESSPKSSLLTSMHVSCSPMTYTISV